MSKNKVIVKKTNIATLVVIVILSSFIGFVYNYFSADGIPFIRTPLIVNFTSIDSTEIDSEGLRGLNLENTLALFNMGTTIFVDARDQWEFSEGHISGAINIPEFSFTPNNKLLQNIEKTSLMLIYCGGEDCDTSKRLASELERLGYSNIYVYLGGFSEWLEAGLSIEGMDNNE